MFFKSRRIEYSLIFLSTEMPVGLSGLFIAAIFAAAISPIVSYRDLRFDCSAYL